MKSRIIVFALLALIAFISGCGYPAFTSAMRSNFPSDAKVEMKCELVVMDTTRDVVNLNTVLNKYSSDGWRLAYLSEYTSSGITSFSNVVCFEHTLK